MRAAILAALFLAASAAPCRAHLSAAGALYYERGHYWIELSFSDAGRDTVPVDLSPERFRIEKAGAAAVAFRPSRVETIGAAGGGPVVVLTSSRLEGRSCYRVSYLAEGGEEVAVVRLCDPFAASPDSGACAGKSFFRRRVAPAFRKDGDPYSLNELAYEYDFSGEKPFGSFALEPRFEAPGFSLAPSFAERTVVYSVPRAGKTETTTRGFGLALSAGTWVRGLRVGLSIADRYDRAAFSFAAGDSVSFTRSLAVEGSLRFDNLFDRVNRHCLSVFKGVDLGAGCAWYGSDREKWSGGAIDRAAPFVRARATWTFLAGFQLSFGELVSWPDDRGNAAEFHSLRFRLLLRDVLPPQAGKSYHPDVELAWDGGTRLPNLLREEKLSIGFTFSLYPW